MRPAAAIFAVCLLAAWASGARGQGTASFDPSQLPAYRGQLQLFTLTPRGEIDGFVMTDGTEVKTPPHLSSAIALAVRPGDSVTIHGLKAAKLPLVQALSVTNDRDGRTVVDTDPGPALRGLGREAAPTRTVSGRVRMVLHGPRGDANGILLEDGTILKLPPPEMVRFADLLKPGIGISAEGAFRVTGAGTVVEVTALGVSPQTLQRVE